MLQIFKKILSHKIILSLAILVLVAIGGFVAWQKFQGSKSGEVRYVTSPATKQTIVESISGTGQVSVSNQVEIKPEASGKAVSIGVQVGQEVKTGTLIAQLDATDALKTVRDAKASLESAQLSLEKLKQPADELSVTKAQNSLNQAEESKLNLETDLAKAYEDGFNDVSDAFLDLPTLMAGLEDVIYGEDLGSNQWNIDYYESRAGDYDYDNEDKVKEYTVKVKASYSIARDAYDQNFEDYKNASRYSDDQTIAALIDQTYETTKDIAEAIKDANNLIDFFEDVLTQYNVSIPAITTTHQNSLEEYTGIANSQLSSLFSAKNTIDNTKADIIDAERSIEEKKGDLAELLAGTDALDLKAQELSVQQKVNSLIDAQEKLADYYVRAPFDGVIATLDIQKGESISSGSSIATLITTQKIAEITLNEIDVAKVKVAQKAILTFDAVEDLSITGEVVEVDTLGEVSSGVVSYGIKIAFDVQDERIKPGMSLSTNIIIESKQDVIAVSIGAVKTANNSSYVEVLVDNQVQRKTVTTGISSDTMIEIISGLAEGDEIITQTVSGSSTNTNASSSSSDNNAMRSMMQLNGGGGGPPN